MPESVRAIERGGDLKAALRPRCRIGAGPGDARRQRLAFEMLHHQEVDALVAADVVQRADVGMIQRRDGPRLALEPIAGSPVVGHTLPAAL